MPRSAINASITGQTALACAAVSTSRSRLATLAAGLYRVDIFLQHDLLLRPGELDAFQPAPVRLRPPGAARIAMAMARQKRQQPLLGLALQMLHVLTRTGQIAQRLLCLIRNPHGAQFAGAMQARQTKASRRSVFTRSPGFFGISDGATTWQSSLRSRNCRQMV